MNKGNLLTIAILVGIIGFVISSPGLRSIFGLRSTEIVTIPHDSQSNAETGDEATANNRSARPNQEEYELVTLLPKDSIRSIDNPQFVTGAEADSQYSPEELVLGIEIEGDARAYSIPFLSGHEIVNDVVAGEPIAVTW